MKVQIKPNTIRIGISKREANRLRDGAILRDELEFGPTGGNQRLAIEIVFAPPSEPCSEVRAERDADTIRIVVPAAVAMSWLESQFAGLESAQFVDTESDRMLGVLLEKDWIKPPAAGAA